MPCSSLRGQPPEAIRVIENKAYEMGSDIYYADMNGITNASQSETGQKFDFEDYRDIRIRLLGGHQLKNAAVTIKTAEVLMKSGFVIPTESLYSGLLMTYWPGRMEILFQNPTIICDGAHNVQGTENLKAALKKLFPGRSMIYLMGVMKDKEYEKMAGIMLEDAKACIAVRIDYDRMLDTGTLTDVMRKYCNNVFSGDTIAEGMNIALEIAGCNDVICSFGSLYCIADVKKYVRERMLNELSGSAAGFGKDQY
jgi:dihydrofolate synthase / folylpolyglutamate synthase